MAKKTDAEMSDSELREQLRLEREKTTRLQEDKERREAEVAREARLKADAAAARDQEPSEEQWTKLEEEYGQTREVIRANWRMVQRALAPVAAELNIYKAKDAANEAVSRAKDAVKSEDPQFPKYERFVDEYLADISIAEKADPAKLAKHIERATHFAKSKARSSDKDYREEIDQTRDGAGSKEEKDLADQGFGTFEVNGMPLTVHNEKLVSDDFRKRHAHPEQKEGVRMNEKARWAEGVPKAPRGAGVSA